MKKDFITVSPESGQGNGSISLIADPNPFANDRSTEMQVRTAGDKSQEVRILQEGLPFHMISLIKFNGYPNNNGGLDFIPYPVITHYGANDDGTQYPIYDCRIKMNDNYNFNSNIAYFIMVSMKRSLLVDRYLELETPHAMNKLILMGSTGEPLNLNHYNGEIFLSNGTGIEDEVSLRLTNSNDAYDYRNLFEIRFT